MTRTSTVLSTKVPRRLAMRFKRQLQRDGFRGPSEALRALITAYVRVRRSTGRRTGRGASRLGHWKGG